jgi:hypothetical protein
VCPRVPACKMGPTNKRAMSLAIIECFLKGGNLCKVLSHMCNNASSSVMDPVSDIVHMMMTCPVQMVISEVCVCVHVCMPAHLFAKLSITHSQHICGLSREDGR